MTTPQAIINVPPRVRQAIRTLRETATEYKEIDILNACDRFDALVKALSEDPSDANRNALGEQTVVMIELLSKKIQATAPPPR